MTEEPLLVTPTMTQREFRALLDLHQLQDDGDPSDSDAHAVIAEFLSRVAKANGWADWVDAYYRVPRS